MFLFEGLFSLTPLPGVTSLFPPSLRFSVGPVPSQPTPLRSLAAHAAAAAVSAACAFLFLPPLLRCASPRPRAPPLPPVQPQSPPGEQRRAPTSPICRELVCSLRAVVDALRAVRLERGVAEALWAGWVSGGLLVGERRCRSD